jgi:hypothetical protein
MRLDQFDARILSALRTDKRIGRHWRQRLHASLPSKGCSSRHYRSLIDRCRCASGPGRGVQWNGPGGEGTAASSVQRGLPTHRICLVDEKGRIFAPAHLGTCDTDQEVIEQAKSLMDGHDIEIWDHTRIVAKIPSRG